MILKLRGTQPGEQIFIVKKEKDSKGVVKETPLTGLSIKNIRIVDVKFEQKEFKKSVKYHADIYFEREWQSHILNMGTGVLTKWIIKSLLNLSQEQLEDVTLSFWYNKQKEVNGGGAFHKSFVGVPIKSSSENKNGGIPWVDAETDEDIVRLLSTHQFPKRTSGWGGNNDDVFDSMDTPSSNKVADTDDLTSIFNEPAPAKKKEDDGEIEIPDLEF